MREWRYSSTILDLGTSCKWVLTLLSGRFFFFLSLWLYSPLDLSRFFSFLILYTVGRTPWTGDQPVARPLPTHRTTQTQNKRTKTSMPQVGLEPTTPVFERSKTVHALDRAATMTGPGRFTLGEIALGTNCIEGRVYPWVRQDRQDDLAPTENGTSAVQPVVNRYTDWAIRSPLFYFD
jgi:hypothetical protein